MLSTSLSFSLVSRDLPRALERTAQTPTASREIAYYEKRIREIKSLDDFMADERVYRFALKAYGLEDMAYAKAFIRKALEGGIDDRDSFANKLADRRYREFVEAFNFKRYGAATTSFSRTQSGAVDRYVRQTLEENEGAKNEGVRLALYFARKAPTLRNAYEILADPALLKVAQTALGLSPQTGAADVDRQAATLERQIKISELQDPAKLERFLARFTAMWELENPSFTPAAPNIQIGGFAPVGIGADLLMSIQTMKRGGF